MAKQYGFVINMQDCYGCKTCAVACKSKNKKDEGVNLRRVRTFQLESPKLLSHLSMACNHCDEPQCLEACPVGAYTKRDDGIVIQDHDRCIGCRSCVMACPYGAPQYDPVEKKTSKCDMCIDRIEEGLQPACVDFCPGHVLKWGEIEDLRKEYGNDIEVVEAAYNLPSHKITKPNVVIVAPH